MARCIIGEMEYPFQRIVIIFNPNSTGDGPGNAKRLQKRLAEKVPKKTVIELAPTNHAGHGEALAKDFAMKYKRLLIVSSSGDGGYNDVVNGVIASKSKTAVVVVLPSGNANDHHRAVSHKSMIRRIVDAEIIVIDGIKIDATIDGRPWRRFAHSYIGFGLTAYIGRKLTEATLNPINEKWLVVKYMLLFRSITLQIQPDLRWHHYASVIFSNINRMSKVIRLAPDAHLKDNRIELYQLRSRSFVRMLISLLFASTVGFKPVAQIERQVLLANKPVDVQLDGEVYILDGDRKITVSVAKNAIRTLC